MSRASKAVAPAVAPRKARAMGCLLPASTAATSASSEERPSSGSTTKSTMRASLSLSVPVLSNTATSTDASCSIASPCRANTPRRASAARADHTATGVARPMEQGQATSRTARPLNTPTTQPLCHVQATVVIAAISITAGRNHATRRSACFWMRPGERRASSTERRSASSRRERPREVAVMRSTPSSARLPAMTWSPARLTTG